MTDDIRPRKTVEVTCDLCDWSFWVDSLDPSLPEGPFLCDRCDLSGTPITTKAES